MLQTSWRTIVNRSSKYGYISNLVPTTTRQVIRAVEYKLKYSQHLKTPRKDEQR
jgi:hypothetical protein